MSISLKCPGCRSKLRLRGDLAGRKVKCPRCDKVLLVPEAEVEVAVAAEEEEEDDRITEAAAPRRKASSRIQREKPSSRGKRTMRQPREEEEEDDRRHRDDKGGKKGKKYKPCPKCGSGGAERVKWTAWGSFYGPAMFSHVRCPECDYCYNGKTGRSNLIPAIIFTLVPLLGIIGIIVAIFIMLQQRGRLPM
jgi:hypothetical protein